VLTNSRSIQAPSSTAAASNAMPEIAVIVPVYNGRPMLRELCSRLARSLSGITQDFVIVLVDDAAPDNPWPLIREISQEEHRIKAISSAAISASTMP
jgi:glycosyltransferase involved in cell wall biosynthesis